MATCAAPATCCTAVAARLRTSYRFETWFALLFSSFTSLLLSTTCYLRYTIDIYGWPPVIHTCTIYNTRFTTMLYPPLYCLGILLCTSKYNLVFPNPSLFSRICSVTFSGRNSSYCGWGSRGICKSVFFFFFGLGVSCALTWEPGTRRVGHEIRLLLGARVDQARHLHGINPGTIGISLFFFFFFFSLVYLQLFVGDP